LSRYEDEPNFNYRIVTQVETWVHHFDPESKRKTKHAVEGHWLTPSKEIQESAISREDDRFNFLDSQGIIMIDNLEQGRTINGTYSAEELRRLRQGIARKKRDKLIQGVLLLHNNAQAAHTSQVAMTAATDCNFEILPHPPYSPDLARSDFYLIPKLKTKLRCRRF
jgi:histone-lysine N-methyltransferase SETMAR